MPFRRAWLEHCMIIYGPRPFLHTTSAEFLLINGLKKDHNYINDKVEGPEDEG